MSVIILWRKTSQCPGRSLLDTGDRRVKPADEVQIKAELKGNKLSQLIEGFHSANSDEERAKLQEEIHKRAEDIHETLKSNEP